MLQALVNTGGGGGGSYIVSVCTPPMTCVLKPGFVHVLATADGNLLL